jgi:hypothetical protein
LALAEAQIRYLHHFSHPVHLPIQAHTSIKKQQRPHEIREIHIQNNKKSCTTRKTNNRKAGDKGGSYFGNLRGY